MWLHLAENSAMGSRNRYRRPAESRQLSNSSVEDKPLQRQDLCPFALPWKSDTSTLSSKTSFLSKKGKNGLL